MAKTKSKSKTKITQKKTTKSKRSSKSKTQKSFKLDSKREIVLGLREPWLSLIGSGQKIVEGRLNYGVASKLKAGHKVIFKNSKKSVHAEVVSVKFYNTFAEMLYGEKFWRVIPGASNFKCALDVYHKVYKKSQEARYGVVAITIKV